MKLKVILSALVCMAVISSCNLDYHEYSTYEKQYVQAEFDHVAGIVSNAYAKLDYDFGDTYKGALLASACDESEYAWKLNEIHDFYNGAWGPANPKSTVWKSSFEGIQICNSFMQDFQGLTFPELALNSDYAKQMERYKNFDKEIRLLRAYFYFNLVRQYGDVPLITTILPLKEVNRQKRIPYSEVIDFIISECDDIVDKIPANYLSQGTLSSTETGRVNRLTVLALKARVLLYAASPLLNKSDDQALWEKAAKANLAVIDSCAKYGIVLETYNKLWGVNNWQAKEMIYVRRIRDDANKYEGYNFPIGVEGGKSGNCPTQTLVDAYEMKSTGKLWDEPGSGFDPTNPYNDRDPRFYLTIAKNGDSGWPAYNAAPLQIYFGGINAEPISGGTPTGYYLKKYCDVTIDLRPSTSNKKRHSWIIYRLGEFYLNYAEATFKTLGSADATSADFAISARDAVNVIRKRQGVDMPELATGLSNDDFWKKYTGERMVELAFEGHRFWDIRRWKEGDKLKTITQLKITSAGGLLTYQRSVVNRVWDDKMYLFPIPQAEIGKNLNLKQNPGW